jgi:hypothetical protein
LSIWPSDESGIDILDAGRVKSLVLSNAGVGKLSSSSSPKKIRQFDRPAPLVPALSSAGPGATPCATPSGAAPKWTWKTIGVKPTAEPSGPTPPHEHSHGAGTGSFPFGFF